jgi:hypothetical protein
MKRGEKNQTKNTKQNTTKKKKKKLKEKNEIKHAFIFTNKLDLPWSKMDLGWRIMTPSPPSFMIAFTRFVNCFLVSQSIR